MFQKALVIGCPGSGKSTFSRSLHKITALPLYHLDLLYWNPDKTTVSKEVFRARLAEILSAERWIIDGNYASTMESRLQWCDIVFFLDFPLEVCLNGVRSRLGRPRDDMPWVETEEDPEFMDYIKRFQAENRPQILSLFEKYPQKNIVTFHSRSEADNYLMQLPNRYQ